MVELVGQTEIQVTRGTGIYIQCDKSGHHVCLGIERGLRATELRIFPADFMGHGEHRQPMKTSTRPLANFALGTIEAALQERQPLNYQHRGRTLFRIRYVDTMEERVGVETFDFTTSRQRR